MAQPYRYVIYASRVKPGDNVVTEPKRSRRIGVVSASYRLDLLSHLSERRGGYLSLTERALYLFKKQTPF